MKVDTDKLFTLEEWRKEKIRNGNNPPGAEYMRKQIRRFEAGEISKEKLGFTPVKIGPYIFVLPN